MGEALDRVRVAMRIIVIRIDRPFVACARMVRMQDPVKHGGAQVEAAVNLRRDAEIERDRLGVADMQVAVRLRREAGHDLLVSACVEIGLDDVANEIASRVRRYRFSRHSLFPSGSENMTRKSL